MLDQPGELDDFFPQNTRIGASGGKLRLYVQPKRAKKGSRLASTAARLATRGRRAHQTCK